MPQTPPRDLGERTFNFACEVVKYSRELSKEPGVVRNIAWQLSDAATSAAANYQEAKAAYSRKEFAVKTSICLKELRESDLWLRVILACERARGDLHRLDATAAPCSEGVEPLSPALMIKQRA